MLLVVDVGNTQTHFGTFRDGELLEHWRFATDRDSTADELGATLRNLLGLRGVVFDMIDASIVSSTVPQLAPEWSSMAERYLGHQMPVVGPGLKTGMAIRIDNPREVGADRLVNAVAAHDSFGGPCVVVDFGTGLNIDVVSREGEYVGGMIAPGIEISMDALTARGAKLLRVDLETPRALIGKSTVEAIRSGVVYRLRGDGRRHPAAAARGAGRGHRDDRHRRAGGLRGAALRAGRRDRRSADVAGAAAHLGAQPARLTL